MSSVVGDESSRRQLRRRGFALEYATLSWNIVGVAILAVLALRSSSVALLAFGLDSLIEIGASTVVIWELSGHGESRQRRALRLIGSAFVVLTVYLLIQSTAALVAGHRASPSVLGVGWTAITACVMFALAWGKSATGRALGNPVLVTEGRVTLVDGILAAAVLLGIGADSVFGWWWADPAAGYVVAFYAAREAITIFRPGPLQAE